MAPSESRLDGSDWRAHHRPSFFFFLCPSFPSSFFLLPPLPFSLSFSFLLPSLPTSPSSFNPSPLPLSLLFTSSILHSSSPIPSSPTQFLILLSSPLSQWVAFPTGLRPALSSSPPSPSVRVTPIRSRMSLETPPSLFKCLTITVIRSPMPSSMPVWRRTPSPRYGTGPDQIFLIVPSSRPCVTATCSLLIRPTIGCL